MERRFPPQKRSRRPPQDEGCKLIFKRKKDGTVIKEIKGKCSREQLEALAMNDTTEEPKNDQDSFL